MNFKSSYSQVEQLVVTEDFRWELLYLVPT